jgi:hypothetical protein
MWVIFNKSDKSVVGTTADTEKDPEKRAAIDEVVRNLAEPPAVADLDAIQVSDRKRAQALLQGIGRGRARIIDSKGKTDVVTQDEDPDTSFLTVSTDAKDFHPVDKVPLMPGDGQAFLTITVTKTDLQGAARVRKTVDTDLLWLRTTNGFLRSDPGTRRPASDNSFPPEIRSIRLTAGTATFRLYSEPAKRLATVQILSEDRSVNNTVIQVEFI